MQIELRLLNQLTLRCEEDPRLYRSVQFNQESLKREAKEREAERKQWEKDLASAAALEDKGVEPCQHLDFSQ